MRFEKIECAGQVLNGSVSICLFGRSECKMCVCILFLVQGYSLKYLFFKFSIVINM